MPQPQHYWRHNSRGKGFTIIEIMIVLAIAALIMLIVFLAVPALQRSNRNYDRKNYASLVYAQMADFYNDNGHYPGAEGNPTSPADETEICNFLKSLPQVSPTAACGHSTASYTSINGTIAENCDTIVAGTYTICYQDWLTVDHGYIGPYDEISVMLAHWCNIAPDNDPSEPVTYTVAGNDTNTTRFAIWTPLEGVEIPYCSDNFAKSIAP